jgi:hypothetical protein
VAASLSSAGANGISIGDLWSAEAMERISSGVERSFPSDTKNVWPAAFEDCRAVVMQLIKLSIDIKLLLFRMEPSGSGMPRLTMPMSDAKFARTPGP